jgi:hypothetical protein
LLFNHPKKSRAARVTPRPTASPGAALVVALSPRKNERDGGAKARAGSRAFADGPFCRLP